MMRIILLSIIFHLGLCTQKADCQNRSVEEAAEIIINNSIQNARALNRTINFYRQAQYNLSRSASRVINNELELQKRANSSMRQAREQLKNILLIRKEKIDTVIDNPNCKKEFNSYVQHECFAFNDPKQPRDSVLLQEYELTVLLKQKKKYYKLCLNGEEYYVLRKHE
jgi:hypothetical protein